MAKLGDLVVRIGANTKDFNKGLRSIKSQIRKDTREIQDMGKSLSIGITAPLAIMGATSVNAFREQNKAIAQVEAGLKSTANQVGFTSKELQQMATDLQNKTLFGDEVILKDATAQLLTFTNISGENFARTQQAALDLATRLDGDLKGASIQLGKALNDPIANLSALSRSGIQFSEDQKAVIKSLTETGRLAEAQTLILDELNKQYGGSAEAAAAADGGFTQLANSFGDLQEEIGRLLVDFLRPIVDVLKTFVQQLQGTSDGTKKFVIVLSGIAAAIGPILFIVPQLVQGLSMVRTAMLALNTAMLANPFFLAATAITAVVGAVALLYSNATDAEKEVAKLRDELNGLDKDEAIRVAAARIEVQKEAVEKQRMAVEALRKQVLVGDAVERRIHMQSIARHSEELAAMEEVLAGFEAVHAELVATVPGAKTVRELLTFLGDGIREATAETKKLAPALVQALEPLSVQSIDNTVVKGLQKLSTKVTEITKKAQEDLKRGQQEMQNFALGIAANLSGIFSGMIDGTFNFKNAMIDALKAVLAQALALLAVFGLMTILTGGIGGKFFESVGGLRGFMQAGFNIPKFASGGIVSGPTMAMVGEYPGARTNPEVIAPLDKLRSMIGGNNVTVTGRLSGRDILLSSEYSAIDRNRVRGF